MKTRNPATKSNQLRPAKGIRALASRYWENESGTTSIEYGIIGVLIATAIVGGVTAVGTGTESMYQYITTTIDDATNK